jgi:hypothetical protein
MSRPSRYRRPIRLDGDIVWLPLSVMAEMYSKSAECIRLWCHDGFILSLGYRLQREPRGHWRIGVPYSEYANYTNTRVAI